MTMTGYGNIINSGAGQKPCPCGNAAPDYCRALRQGIFTPIPADSLINARTIRYPAGFRAFDLKDFGGSARTFCC